MAAANFSREPLENFQTNVGDLIDFGTDFEDPTLETIRMNVEKYLTIRYYCDWLKVGKKEKCGKRCKNFYCSAHLRRIRNGGVIPIPCFGCGVGVTRPHYLCAHCEKYSGL